MTITLPNQEGGTPITLLFLNYLYGNGWRSSAATAAAVN